MEELHKVGKYAEAVPIAQRAVALAEQQSGPHHPTVARSLEKLAVLYYRLGRLCRSRTALQAGARHTRTGLGPDHPDVGTTLNNLAVVSIRRVGMKKPSRSSSARSRIRERLLGPEPPGCCARRSTTWRSFTLFGSLRRGRTVLQAFARDPRRRCWVRRTPSVGESLNNLAMLYESQGRYADAVRLLMRAFAIRQKAMGADRPGYVVWPRPTTISS